MAPVTDDLWTAVTIQGWDAHEGCQQLLAQDSVDFTQASGPSNDRVICTVEPPHQVLLTVRDADPALGGSAVGKKMCAFSNGLSRPVALGLTPTPTLTPTSTDVVRCWWTSGPGMALFRSDELQLRTPSMGCRLAGQALRSSSTWRNPVGQPC
jgi:hypothetical protein